MSNIPTPVDIKQASATEMGIKWSDGHESIYPFEYLRKECPCASCTHYGKLKAATVKDVTSFQIKSVSPVGRYAINILWADGHDTGIYSYEFLREICRCKQCSSKTVSRTGETSL